MKKTISITNEEVERILSECQNRSRYIEEAVLFYNAKQDSEYVTRFELEELLLNYLKVIKAMVCK